MKPSNTSRLSFGCLGFATNAVFYKVDRPSPTDPWLWEIGSVYERGREPTFESHEGFLPRYLEAPPLPSGEEILQEYRLQFDAMNQKSWINTEPVQAG